MDRDVMPCFRMIMENMYKVNIYNIIFMLESYWYIAYYSRFFWDVLKKGQNALRRNNMTLCVMVEQISNKYLG